MMAKTLPTPDDVEAVSNFLTNVKEIGWFIVGGLLFLSIWVWRISKMHTWASELTEEVRKIKERELTFATIESVKRDQSICREQISHDLDNRLRDLMLIITDKQDETNRNLFILMGAQGVKPVKSERRANLRNYYKMDPEDFCVEEERDED